MNRPTQQEILAMRQRYAPVQQPKKPLMWKVISCGQTLYENESIALCWWFIRKHGLNTKPVTKK